MPPGTEPVVGQKPHPDQQWQGLEQPDKKVALKTIQEDLENLAQRRRRGSESEKQHQAERRPTASKERNKYPAKPYRDRFQGTA